MNIPSIERDRLGLFSHESVMNAMVRDLSSTSSNQSPTSPAIKFFTCLVINDSSTHLENDGLKKLSESIRDTYSNNSCRGGSVDSVQSRLNSLSLINQDLSIVNNVGAVDGEISGVKSECFDCQITSRLALDFINLEKLRSNTPDKLQLHNELRSYGFIKLVESLKDTSITLLNLSANGIDCDLLIDLVQHLHSTQIQSLDLSTNKIGHKGFEYLNKALKETQISSLNVSGNCPRELRCMKHCSEIENSVEKEYVCNSQCYVTDILENSATTFLDLSYPVVADPEYVTSILRNSKIEHLDFNRSKINVESFGLFAPYLVDSSVTTLNLSGCNKLGNDGLKILASLLKNTNIHTLDVSRNNINGNGLKVFAPSLVHSKITSLNISYNRLDIGCDYDGISSLALVLPKTKIFSLDLNFCFISNESCRMLLACLPHTKITSLGFANNVPNDNDVESLAVVLKNSQISSICVGALQSAGETIVQLLSLWVVGSQLTNINLDHCKIDCSLMKDLVNAVKNSNITSIRLTCTSMNCEVMEIFVSFLVNSKISNLHLQDGFNMSIGAVKCLALALKNTEISSLDLSGNMLDSDSLKVLAPCLVGTRLTHLNLKGNRMDRVPKLIEKGCSANWDERNVIGVKYLAQALKSSEITHLNLAGNKLSCKSLQNLILSLPYTKIETLNLNGNSICCNNFFLADILMNTKISSLELGSQQGSNCKYQFSFNTFKAQMQCIFYFYHFLHKNVLHTENITSLNLSYSQISCCGEMKELSKSLSGSQVASLDLSSNSINCDGIYYLAQVLQRSKIISLNLGKNEISSNGVKYLAMNFPGSQIEIVDLSYNFITDESIEYLSDNLVNTKIVHLNLSGNQVGCQAVYHLCESVAEINVQLDSNLFRYPGCLIEIKQISLEKGIDHLIDYVSDKTEVTKVYIQFGSSSVNNGSKCFYLGNLASIDHFSKINITEIEMARGSSFPYSIFKNITQLKLNNTLSVDEPGKNGEIIIELKLQNIENFRFADLTNFNTFRFNNIMYLDLSNNNMKDDEFRYIANAFEYGYEQINNCLISLNLSNNQLGVKSAEILAIKVLPFTRALTYIDLKGNNIGYLGFKSLMNVVDKTNLCWLSLGENNIEDQLQEDMELSPYIVPRNADEIPVAFQVRYLFMQLVSLNTPSGELEFTVPTIDSNPPVNVTHYPKLITIYNLFKNDVENLNMHVYDYYYMKSKKHDKQLMEEIDNFVKELEKRFLSFIDSNLTILEQAFGYESFVLLVKECERSGLTRCVESLLLHRVLYYVDDDGEILHPFIYRMMLEYNIPLYNEQMEPNKRDQIISYFQIHSEFEEAQTIVDLLAYN
ncbi:uncharacterized protein LOC111043276 isoform X1 [Nilaparvata lugens]|uniref:uncharacterized protein LOC111043276 isoform X1 n=1 Tax=Nilaparvata lugens TaxID=108931 RepID=UPI00193CC912|nr:uncharacterized protein LOC111043276 isoform X1 [Nilaparvata lugens]XP_039289107.1 uncharacterized protein LOC111043276 isoform X1 [Nilaparvata lugens]XP_039289108.1 uncharacterized protein LOC111043276 isoform X1 [Nilaparvata lugens]